MALNSLLDASPTDAEAWAELADLYISQGLYQQGIFALEEVLLITPNAWNVSARNSTTRLLPVIMLILYGIRSTLGLGKYSMLRRLPLAMDLCRSRMSACTLRKHCEGSVGV